MSVSKYGGGSDVQFNGADPGILRIQMTLDPHFYLYASAYYSDNRNCIVARGVVLLLNWRGVIPAWLKRATKHGGNGHLSMPLQVRGLCRLSGV